MRTDWKYDERMTPALRDAFTAWGNLSDDQRTVAQVAVMVAVHDSQAHVDCEEILGHIEKHGPDEAWLMDVDVILAATRELSRLGLTVVEPVEMVH